MSVVEACKEEHRELEQSVEELVRLAEKDAKGCQEKAFLFFRRFKEHAIGEERRLFDPVRHGGVMKPGVLQELLQEHKRIYFGMGSELRQALDRAAEDPRRLVAAARSLQMTVKRHFHREETAVFPQAGRLVES